MAIALAALGVTLMVTNPWFTAVDDEIAIVDVAANPAWQTIKLFLSGGGQHEHPPLSDLILHGWLWLTNGNSQWLRLPSVIFYLLGIWFLVRAARRIGGDRAGYGNSLSTSAFGVSRCGSPFLATIWIARSMGMRT